MNRRDIYRITSIGRPLDPACATNLAVIRLLPVAAVIAAGVEVYRHGVGVGLAWAVLSGALVAFGSWALARELAPDHDPAAFAAMVLSFGTWLVLTSAPVLPLFLALLLVRVVNRSTGLPARPSDSVIVAALVVLGAWLFASPWLALLGGLAFLLDAALPPVLPRQRIFALLCAGVGMWLFTATGEPTTPAPGLTDVARWLTVAITVLCVIVILLTRRVRAVGDVGGEPLSAARVRAGMWVGLFVAAQGLLTGVEATQAMTLVWASLAGSAVHRPLDV